MFTRKLVTAAVVATLAAGHSLAADVAAHVATGTKLSNGKSSFGQTVAEGQSTRLIDTRQAKAINVQCGDIITFVNGDKRFAWKFDATHHGVVALANIAPADFGAGAAKVYVSRSEAEPGG